MKRLYLLLLTVVAAVCMVHAAPDEVKEPDFAYPRTVIKDATAVLNNPTAPEQDRLAAAMQITVAAGAISPDSLFVMPAMLDELCGSLKQPDVIMLARLYEARTYNDIYTRARWRYDRVDAPLLPRPADVNQWSGAQFRACIDSLVTLALDSLAPVATNPLRDYSKIIEADARTLQFYPTLAGFVRCVAIDLLQDMGKTDRVKALQRQAVESTAAGTLSNALWTVRALQNDDKALLKRYNEYPGGEAAGYILYNLSGLPDSVKIIEFESYLDRTPRNMFTDVITDRLKWLKRPCIELSAPRTVLPGTEFEVTLTANYIRTGGVAVYRVTNPAEQNRNYRMTRLSGKSVEMPEKYGATGTVKLTFDTDGLYELRPIVNGVEAPQRGGNLYVLATSLRPTLLNNAGNVAAVMTDMASGRPSADVKVVALVSSKNPQTVLGATDADGILRLPASNLKNKIPPRYTDIGAIAGGKLNAFGRQVGLYGYFNEEEADGQAVSGTIYTDRALYHPGDSLQWSLTAIRTPGRGRGASLAADIKADVVLYDANGNDIDTISVATDSYGRAHGVFALPASGLTGMFSLHAVHDSNYIGGASVTVSDFKAPTFEVDTLTIERGAPAEGDVTVRGRAITYSGMPVAGADVAVRLTECPRWCWWFRRAEGTTRTFTAVTDADGCFEAVINADGIEPGEDYSVSVTVTDRAASTAERSTFFTTGKPFIIESGIARQIDCTKATVLNLKAYDGSGRASTLAMNWWLEADGRTARSGRADITSEGLTLDLADIDPGKYTFRATPVDTALCDADTIAAKVTLYSTARNLVPDCVPAILPVREVKAAPGTEASFRLGLPRPADIFVAIGRRGGVEVKRYSLPAGFSDLKVIMPADTATADVRVFGGPYEAWFDDNVQLIAVDPSELRLETAVWRDKLVPGTQETWTLRLSRADGTPVSGAMVATMYNHALDALKPYSMPLLYSPQGASWLSLSSLGINPTVNSYFPGKMRRGSWFNVQQPDFRYTPVRMHMMLRVRGNVRYNSMATEVVEDAVLYESAVTNSAADYGAARPEAKAMLSAGATADSATAEAEPIEEEAEQAEGAAQPAEDLTLRTGQTLQAFWMPQIDVDADGSARLTFTVPNANTTWAFHALAWTADAQSTSMDRLAVASKPVMVQPNLPRFLREGDEATVRSTVYNRSDLAVTADITVEVFDPATGLVSSRDNMQAEIAANGSYVVATTMNAPVGQALVGYRIIARVPGFSDGEQQSVPILESGITVIDGTTFVLNEQNPTFTSELPRDKDAIIAVQYCANPVWEVVKAMPRLYTVRDEMTSPEAAVSAFGALLTRGLAKRYPQIPQVIDMWESEPSDSALVSKLLKNEDLKAFMADGTPWMRDAASQNERMAALSTTFDAAASARTLDKAVAALKKLQNPDGGFRWGSWCDRSSLWATSTVLSLLGELNRYGFIPAGSDIDRITARGLKYVENSIRPNDYTVYPYLLSLYPGHKPTTLAGRRAVDRAVQDMIRNWRKASTSSKAMYALTLKAFGYGNTASEIMRSVGQFAVSHPDGSISFPSVTTVDNYTTLMTAFAAIEPGVAPLDGMRQWLVARTRLNDDLGVFGTAQMVAALLATGTEWTSLPSDSTATITVGGRAIVPDKIEYATGSISLRLPADDAGQLLTVTRPQGPAASYGSLTTVSKQPIDSVAAADCPDLAVTKRFLVERDGAWVVTKTPRLGERVRVQIMMTVNADMQYLTVTDLRPSALEPVDQLPGYTRSGVVSFYRENRDSSTNLFIDFLPKGTYYVTYDATVMMQGRFATGPVTVQSQYAPAAVARSSASRLTVTE